jgi:hypothetical protein
MWKLNRFLIPVAGGGPPRSGSLHKPLSERTRKALLVYESELDTAGSREEGDAISTGNIDWV